MKPTVAVCIPTFNQSAFLTAAIESAFAQTHPNLEVWVSDDCSTDATAETATRLVEKFPGLRYCRQPRNLGISGNNNWLLSQPDTDFVVRLDSDDSLFPGYVETLAALLNRYPAAGYAHCAVQEIDQRDAQRRVRRVALRGEYQQPDHALRASLSGYRVAANICMFRSQVLRALHYYRDGLDFAEDWDLSVRIADAGWGNVYSDKILARYRVWEDAGKVRPKRKATEIRGCLQVYEKSLLPAFERRGWETDVISGQRRAKALAHGVILDSDHFTAEERSSLIELLQELGPSNALTFQTVLLRLGLGPCLRLLRHLGLRLRDAAKRILLKTAASTSCAAGSRERGQNYACCQSSNRERERSGRA